MKSALTLAALCASASADALTVDTSSTYKVDTLSHVAYNGNLLFYSAWCGQFSINDGTDMNGNYVATVTETDAIGDRKMFEVKNEARGLHLLYIPIMYDPTIPNHRCDVYNHMGI